MIMQYVTGLLRKLTRDTKIYHKLIVTIILLIIMPMCFLSYTFLASFRKIIENEVSKSYDQVVNQYMDNINYKINIYKSLLDGVVRNSVVQEVFINQGESSKQNIIVLSKKISKEIDPQILKNVTTDFASLMLYSLDENFPTDGDNIGNIKDLRENPWFNEVEIKRSGSYSLFHTKDFMDRRILPMIKPIYNLSGKAIGQKLGYARINIEADNIFSIGNMNNKEKFNAILIMDKSGKEIFSNMENPEPLENYILKHDSVKAHNTKIVSINDEKGILIYKRMNDFGWNGVFFFQYNEIEGKVADIGKATIITIFILLVVSVSLTILFSRFFSGRISRLVKKMKKVEDGNLNLGDIIEGKDEISVLDHHFIQMIIKLKKTINELYISQLEKRDAELAALQSQINPHFLYNTLESINSIASINGINDISDICQKLGDMFHYSINTDRKEIVTLYDEIKHISNYVFIQRIRFNNLFDIYYDIPEEMYYCRVIKFILQPIVENSICHGFNGKPGKYCLEVSGRIEDKKIILRIQDDGVGISKEDLADLNVSINNVDQNVLGGYKGSIGIKNVNSRIKLAYGDEYGISIFSELNVGTKVIITLPLHDYKEGIADV